MSTDDYRWEQRRSDALFAQEHPREGPEHPVTAHEGCEHPFSQHLLSDRSRCTCAP